MTKILTGIRREFGMKQDHRKPVIIADIRRTLAAIDRQTLIGKRDAALVLISFATASRSNETVHLNIEDLEERPESVFENTAAGQIGL